MDPETPSQPNATPSSLDKLRGMQLPLWVSVVLAVALALMFFWKQAAVSSAEKRLDAERQTLTAQLASEKSAVLAQARDAIARNSEAAHLMFGSALAWAVRGEMIRANLDQIDQFFDQLVRNERIRVVLLAGTDGKILLASDRKLQGSILAEHFPANLTEEAAVVVRPGEGLEKLLVLPIHGLSARLGTVVLAYLPETGPE
jgi:hypothetical protein